MARRSQRLWLSLCPTVRGQRRQSPCLRRSARSAALSDMKGRRGRGVFKDAGGHDAALKTGVVFDPRVLKTLQVRFGIAGKSPDASQAECG